MKSNCHLNSFLLQIEEIENEWLRECHLVARGSLEVLTLDSEVCLYVSCKAFKSKHVRVLVAFERFNCLLQISAYS